MMRLDDDALIDALRERFDTNRRAINDLRVLTGKLEGINRKLQDAERLKSHFLSNIRNEINNPLTAIMGFAYQLKTGPVSAEQAVRNGRLIYHEAFELNCQMENIFIAAGLEAGQEAPVPAQIDVVTVISEVLTELEHRVHEKGIEVCCSPVQSLPFVADPRFLKIILRNLVANALEFSPRWGIVTVEVSSDVAALQVDIRDNGPGISPADQATIFDRFRQLDSGSCKQHRGHGLGLSVCSALVELSGGTIGIKSDLGQGSIFSLTLPHLSGDVPSLCPDEDMFSAAGVETY
jgi:signal transduction histidine kinase